MVELDLNVRMCEDAEAQIIACIAFSIVQGVSRDGVAIGILDKIMTLAVYSMHVV
jgi:hypothetical protein